MKFKKNGGFTLVELIVVIAILAILAGIAVPAYSGYISKAEKAADLQLLDAVNTAFGAACIENNTSVADVDSASMRISDDGTLMGLSSLRINGTNATSAVIAEYQASFNKYYQGNEASKFNVIRNLNFANGVFGEGEANTFTSGNLSVNLSQSDVQNWNGSTFAGMGDSLLNQIGMVSGSAVTLMQNTDGTLFGIVSDEEYRKNLASTMGMTDAELEEYLMSQDDGGAGVLANSLVLSVAQTANGMNSTDITAMLTGGNVQKTIGDSLNTDPQKGLAQAALAYGMYTAYAQQSGNQELIDKANSVSDPTQLTNIVSEFNDPAFQAYVNSAQGQSDLAGYLSGLNMVNDAASSDSGAAKQVLTNGFTDADLAGLLGSLASGN